MKKIFLLSFTHSKNVYLNSTMTNYLNIIILFMIPILLFFIKSANGQITGSPWPMFHHDPQHTGRSLATGPDTLNVKWTYAASSWIQSSAAIGKDGMIYVGSSDYRLHAIKPDGTSSWTYKTGSFIDASPAIDDSGVVYVGSVDGKLYALNPDGTLKWTFSQGNTPNTPTIGSDGTIYIGSRDKRLFALWPNGTLKWDFLTNGEVNCSPAIGSDGTIYIGSDDGRFYAINPDGSLQWSYHIGYRIRSSPAVDNDGTIYFGSHDYHLYALNYDGSLKWRIRVGNQVNSSPAISADGKTIYVGSEDTYLYAINSDGTLKWSFQTGAAILSSPAIDASGRIFVGSFDKKVYAINPDGTLLWEFETGNGIFASPAIGRDGTIYVGSKDNKLYAFGYPEDYGDLTVGWISRSPEIDYVWAGTNPAVEGWPAVGQSVTWQAHIKNWSSCDRHNVSYKWYLDGVEAASGEVNIPADSTIVIDFPWSWTFDRHELEFVVDPDNQVLEQEESNNSLMIYTDAISAGFYVEQSIYDYFHQYQHKLGVHSNCWEDWAQRQVSRWNEMFAKSVHAETPDGVLDRIRLDKITIVPDGTLPLVTGGSATQSPNLNDLSVDIQRGFPVTLLMGKAYSDHILASDKNPFYYESALLHEIGHARYLVDLYGFNVQDNGLGNTVAIRENGRLIVGTKYLPFLSGDTLYHTKEDGLMNTDYTKIDRYSARALNRIAGNRATYGNYNPPQNMGEFLNDLPAENRLTLKDTSGNILSDADIKIFQATGKTGSFYGKFYDNIPDLELTTDVNGQVLLGTCPFDSDSTIEHTHEKANGTLILRAEHKGRVGYSFLDVTDFNMEYWQGNTSEGNYEIQIALSEANADTTITWQSNLIVKDAGTNQGILTFGTSAVASDELDLALDEKALPQIPSSGIFDARFELPVTPIVGSLKDYRHDGQESITWKLKLQPGSSGYPLKLSWNSADLPVGNFHLKDDSSEPIINLDMKTVDSLVISNNTINSLIIEMNLITWKVDLTVTDAGDGMAILSFGQGHYASDSLDSFLGETRLPPTPPVGAFDARFELPLSPSTASLKDYRNDAADSVRWKIRFQPGSAGFPVTLQWDSTALPDENLFLKDELNGAVVKINMKRQSSVTITNSAITTLIIAPLMETISEVTVAPGWNIISVPLVAADMSVSALFPDAVSSAFGFENGYVITNTLSNGVGYWLKFNNAAVETIMGIEVPSKEIPVKTGWNMIGPYESDVPIADITSEPIGIVQSNYFEFDNGYQIAASLRVGKGYWVKTSQEGTLKLPGGASSNKAAKSPDIATLNPGMLKKLPQIHIEDRAGHSTTLFLTTDVERNDWLELPPVPPAGIFDVRFSTNRFVEKLNNIELEVLIQFAQFPIKLRAENLREQTLKVKDALGGEIISDLLADGRELLITQNLSRILLSLSEQTSLPAEFELSQNYPNPFNPTTKIKFALPENFHIQISIYNVLGENVATIVDEQLAAGYHQVEVNAQDFASGVYFYVLQVVGRFREVRKMILMK
ncbi:PQQ-binding-like beta-propeller repeat protein [candidate division KSB1 bacterium]|nr:PQQ-binding-like beta-propeller repeat protein [candidate division KSB1 bacterium]